MLSLVMPTAFENVQEPIDVTGGVGVRIDQGIPDAGLRRQMHHAPNGMLFEERRYTRTIGQIQFDELKLGMRTQAGQPRFLETHVIVVIQIVQTEHGVTAIEQSPAHMRPDKSGGAGDEH